MSITTTVPTGVTTGPVVVTILGQSSNAKTFTILGPIITSLSPTSGAVSASVTITGTNFGASQGSSTVLFNGTAATPTGWSSMGTSITVNVPSGATSGPVSVQVAGNSSNGRYFTVTGSSTTSNIFYYFTDALGTPRVITDAEGTVCYDADMYPYGGARIYTDTCDSAYKFTTYERDPAAEGGADYAQARFYGANLGRFLSPDPLGVLAANLGNPQSFNQYAYVDNNPSNLFDPTGLVIPQCPPLCPPPPPPPPGPPAFSGPGCGDYVDGSSIPCNSTGDDAPIPIYVQPRIQLTGRPVPQVCKNGFGAGNVGVGVGGNFDVGAGFAGLSATANAMAALFHNLAGGELSGWSGGATASGGVAAYAGSHIKGAPSQSSNTTFVLGGYAGAGPNVTFGNAASAQQLKGTFTTLSVNVGFEIANLGVQVSFGNGIWQVSITPPVVSAGFGAAASVITTNTKTTHTGC